MLVNVPRLQSKLDSEGLDGLVATTYENLLYLTDIESVGLFMFPHSAQAYAVVTRDEPEKPFYVSSVGELDQTLDAVDDLRGTIGYGTFYRETLSGADLSEEEQFLHQISVEATPARTPLDALVAALKEMGLADKRVGIDEVGLLPGYFQQLGERLDGEVRRASDILQWIRMVKTEEEIRRIRHSAQITERALIAVQGIVRPSVTEYEIAREFERSIVSQGGRPKFALVRIGRNGISGQVQPDDTRLEQGETIWFDVGCTYQGYWSDIARIFSLGDPGERMRTFYHAMLVGENAGISAAKPGMTAGELFDLTVQAVREAGVSHYKRHHVGHGIGAAVYDAPLLASGVEIPLEEGMVINIETPYYEFGFGAVHVEDPFVVRSTGNVLLTELSRELHVIG
jgi:Xaa-Pro dipeptidase